MKKYWKGIEDIRISNEKDPHGNYSHDPPIELKNEGASSNRRDFLKTFGFAIAGTAVAASCERPVTKAIPYLIKPEEIIPGKSSFTHQAFTMENFTAAFLSK